MHVFTTNTIKKIPADSLPVALAVKALVLKQDAAAQTILFGSRARGDAGIESDWDFLVLTDTADTEKFAAVLRKAVREKIELVYLESISIIVKNKKLWSEDYAVTNIFESITEEGIII